MEHEAMRLYRHLSFPCPMGARCKLLRSNASRLIHHGDLPTHPAECWEIQFIAGDHHPAVIGEAVKLSTLVVARGSDRVTIADVLLAAAPSLQPWLLLASSPRRAMFTTDNNAFPECLRHLVPTDSPARGKLVVTRATDDVVVPLSAVLSDTWCTRFRCYFT